MSLLTPVSHKKNRAPISMATLLTAWVPKDLADRSPDFDRDLIGGPRSQRGKSNWLR